MRVQAVEIENYGSFYGQHQVDLANKGLVFIRGINHDEPRMNSNGSGKSTSFDALDWCLFGVVPKDDHADSIVNEEAKKNCLVRAHLVDEVTGDRACVQRGRKPNTLDFWKNDKHLTQMDVKATQALIEEFLGLDRRVFHAAVYRSQDDSFDFANATDSEKKELLSKMIPEFQEIDVLKARCATELSRARKARETTDGMLRTLEQKIEVLEAKDWDTAERQWLETQAHRIEEIDHSIVLWHQTKETQKAELARFETLQQEYSTLVQSLEAHNPQSLQPLAPSDELEQAAQVLASAAAAAEQIDAAICRLNQLGEGEGECPTCYQTIPVHHLRMAYDSMKIQYERQLQIHQQDQVVFDQLQKSREEAEAKHQAWVNGEQAKWATSQQRIGELRGQLASKPKVEEFLSNLDSSIAEAALRKKQIEESMWPEADQRKKDAAEILKLKGQQKAVIMQASHLETEIGLYEFWDKALGLRGLKSFILDTRLEEMSHAANIWVKALTDGTHWIQFESQTQNRSGKVTEKVNVRVFRSEANGDVSDRNYKSYSGGEKKRIALGIDQGLSALVANRATKNWKLYILDEAFRQNIDSAGREVLFEVLEHFGRERESIFVIDHDSELAGEFDNIMTVERRHKRSSFEQEEPACQQAVNS